MSPGDARWDSNQSETELRLAATVIVDQAVNEAVQYVQNEQRGTHNDGGSTTNASGEDEYVVVDVQRRLRGQTSIQLETVDTHHHHGMTRHISDDKYDIEVMDGDLINELSEEDKEVEEKSKASNIVSNAVKKAIRMFSRDERDEPKAEEEDTFHYAIEEKDDDNSDNDANPQSLEIDDKQDEGLAASVSSFLSRSIHKIKRSASFDKASDDKDNKDVAALNYIIEEDEEEVPQEVIDAANLIVEHAITNAVEMYKRELEEGVDANGELRPLPIIKLSSDVSDEEVDEQDPKLLQSPTLKGVPSDFDLDLKTELGKQGSK